MAHLQQAEEPFHVKVGVWFETGEPCDDADVLNLLMPYQQPILLSAERPTVEIPFRLEKVRAPQQQKK